jgi:hypothetical protein
MDSMKNAQHVYMNILSRDSDYQETHFLSFVQDAIRAWPNDRDRLEAMMETGEESDRSNRLAGHSVGRW